MGGMSWIHWAVVLLIVVLIFGTKKLKNIGQDLGGAVKGFKDGIKDGSKEGGAEAAKPAESASLQQSPPAQPTSGQTIDVEVKK